jgi:hypothetical protein
MVTVHITGYHTCKKDGGWSYILNESPFLSGSGNNQWLTQGYYFWTDSDYFAHKWGKDSYNNEYAIVKCDIEVDEELLLDLVGSTSAQVYFKRLLTKFALKLKKIDPSKEASVTVNAVIAYWRKQAKINSNVFPFIAIKVQDGKRGTTLSFSGKPECMFVDIQRQQLCLFEEGLHFLVGKELTYPKEFVIGENHD